MTFDEWITALADDGSPAPRKREALAELRDALRGDDDKLRSMALQCVAHVGMDAAELREDLVHLWQAPHSASQKRDLISALARVGEVQTLAEGMSHAGHRRLIAGVLRPLGARAAAAAPALVDSLRDDEKRQEAIHALADMGAAAVPALVAGLGDPSPRLRGRALRTLGFIGPAAASAFPSLVAAVGDRDEQVRSQAAFALGYVQALSHDALVGLVRALEDDAQEVRREAKGALRRIGPRAAAVVELLISRRHHIDEAEDDLDLDEDEDLLAVLSARMPRTIGPADVAASGPLADEHYSSKSRIAAALAVWRICNDAAAASAALRELAEMGIPPRRRALLETAGAPPVIMENEERMAKARRFDACEALLSMGAAAGDCTGILAAALQDAEVEVRENAVEAVPKVIADRTVIVPLLVHLLDDDAGEVRWKAIRVLIELGVTDSRIGDALRQTLDKGGWSFGPSSWDTGRAIEALEAMRGLGPAAAPFQPTLEFLRGRYDLRADVVYTLAVVQGRRELAVSELMSILADTDPPCPCQTAARFLGEIGPAASAAVPLLVRMARHGTNSYNRLAALKALRRIDPRAAENVCESFT